MEVEVDQSNLPFVLFRSHHTTLRAGELRQRILMLRQLGGPGPVTLAFRQILRPPVGVPAAFASTTTTTQSKNARKSKSPSKPPQSSAPESSSQAVWKQSAHTKLSTTKASRKSSKKNSRNNQTEEQREAHPQPGAPSLTTQALQEQSTFHNGPVKNSFQRSSKKNVEAERIEGNRQSKGESQPSPPTDSILAALPPTEASGVETKETQLAQHLAYKEVPQALGAWNYLLDTNTTGLLLEETYESISNFVDQILANKHGIDIGHWAAHEPQMLQSLVSMAVEAAVHGSWRGYNLLQLRLIGIGRPHEVVASYERFKKRAWEYQEKDPKNLNHTDREVRLNSRLTGEGLVPLLCGNMAALTMLNQFDTATLHSLLDSDFNPNELDPRRIDLSPIHDQFWTTANRAAAHALWQQFLANLQKYRTAILCYHSVALVFRIRAYGRQKDASHVNRIYDEMMNASTGPDRFIIPVDPDSKIQHYEIIPLTMTVWQAFMMAYARLLDYDKLIDLVDIDMAARYPRVPTAAYRNAMLLLALVANRSKSLKHDKKARDRVHAKIEEYWAHIVGRGEDKEFVNLQWRMESLVRMDQQAHVERLYRRGISKLRRERHPGVLHLTGTLFYSYCQKGELEAAEKLLQQIPTLPPPSGQRRKAFKPFVMGCVSAKANYGKRRRLLTQVMLKAQDDISPALWGVILRFFLHGSGAKDVRGVCKAFASKERGVPAQFWNELLSALMGDGTQSKLPEQVLRAGVYILERLFPRSNTASPFRTLAAWTTVQTAIERSEVLSASERHDLIEATMACLPRKNYEGTLRARVMVIALNRKDQSGTPEALHQWNLIKDSAPPATFNALLAQLLRLGFKSTARDIASDIPFEPRYRHTLAFAQQNGLYAGHLPSYERSRAVEVDRSASIERELGLDKEEQDEEEEEDDEPSAEL